MTSTQRLSSHQHHHKKKNYSSMIATASPSNHSLSSTSPPPPPTSPSISSTNHHHLDDLSRNSNTNHHGIEKGQPPPPPPHRSVPTITTITTTATTTTTTTTRPMIRPLMFRNKPSFVCGNRPLCYGGGGGGTDLSGHGTSTNTSSSATSTTTNKIRSPISIKTPSTFANDLWGFVPGSIPHSGVVALTIGVVCGIVASVYYAGLEWGLQYVWKTLPEQWFWNQQQVNNNASSASTMNHLPNVLWIPCVVFVLAIGVGLSVRILGEPGDLPSTIQNVHEDAYISMDHVIPMVVASQFSILGGGSLGPEAPLVAICAALGGFVSQTIFKTTDRNIIRKHTLMGMSGALAAFFGCPLGGSLFALEVNSRFGIEYFEHTVEAVFCGEVCLAVFRALANLPIQPIWDITATKGAKLASTEPLHIVYGALLGLFGAAIAAVFTKFHFFNLGMFRSKGLLRDEAAIPRALCGAAVFGIIGMMIPATMFWGEYEFQTIATLAPSSTLPHVWPTRGLFHFEMDNFSTSMLVGIGKLIAISFTVCGGYRGGFIFPLFCSGAALGRAVHFGCPFVPVQLCVLCMAAALNVAVTRTSISTTLILTFLAGEQNAISAILAAALTSLFATAYMPFIKTQVARADIESSIFILDDLGEDCYLDDTGTAATDPMTPFPADVKTSYHASSPTGGV